MKKLTTLLLLVSNLSFAQINLKQGPSQFDKFIISPEIEWASYLIDTIHIINPQLNKLLTLRYDKGEIKASYPLELGWNHLRAVDFMKKPALDNDMLYPIIDPIYDSLGIYHRQVIRKIIGIRLIHLILILPE